MTRSFRITMLLLIIASACADPSPPTIQPSRITVASGNWQSGAAKHLLPTPVTVQVFDANDHPLSHVVIHVTVATGGGLVSVEQVTTGDDGTAQLTWTLGDATGVQRLELLLDGGLRTDISAIACAPEGCDVEGIDSYQLLNLSTYEGSGQVVHPDVAIVSQLAVPYWLAITPYPNGNALYENPSMYEGPDGVSWTAPPALTNPVEHPSSGAYLSDPDITFNENDGNFWLYYREVVSTQNLVQLVRSSDGVHWDTPINVVTAPSHQVVSPSVVRGAPGGAWSMWAVNSGPAGCAAATTSVERRTSTDGVHWNAAQPTDLAQPGQNIWHIDVQWIPSRNEFWAIYNTYPVGYTCVTGALWLARSSDGTHWTTSPSPIVRRGVIPEFADVVYRSTFVVWPSTGLVTFWMSGASYAPATGYTWRAATVTRRIEDLLSTVSAPASTTLQAPRRGLPPPERDVGGPAS